MTPPGSGAAGHGQGTQSQLTANKSGSLEIQFKIPQKLAPVFLAFNLVRGGAGKAGGLIGPARGSPHFAVPIGLQRGSPLKYGEETVRTTTLKVSGPFNELCLQTLYQNAAPFYAKIAQV